MNMISDLIIDTVFGAFAPYVDSQIQNIVAQFDAMKTQVNALNKQIIDLQSVIATNIDEQRAALDAKTLHIRELELMNENLRLQLELRDSVHNVEKTPNNVISDPPVSNSQTNKATLTTDIQPQIEHIQPNPKCVITRAKKAVEWIKNNPLHKNDKGKYYELAKDYYNRYLVHATENGYNTLNQSTFEEAVIEHTGRRVKLIEGTSKRRW